MFNTRYIPNYMCGKTRKEVLKEIGFVLRFPFLHGVRNYIMSKLRYNFHKYFSSKDIRKKYFLNKHQFKMNSFEEKHYQELHTNGFTVLENYFEKETIEDLHRQVDNICNNLDVDMRSGHCTNRIPTQIGLSYNETKQLGDRLLIENPLIKIDGFTNIAFDESILKIVTNYIEMIPGHRTYAVRAFPNEEQFEPQNQHKDFADYNVMHAFVYLEDVDDYGGPFVYVPKSNNSFKSFLPINESKKGSIKNYGRVSDEELSKYFPEKEWAVCKALKGSVVIVDVRGFHKGPYYKHLGDLKNKHRDVLQMSFFGRSSFFKKSTPDSQEFYLSPNDISSFSDLQKLFLDFYNKK